MNSSISAPTQLSFEFVCCVYSINDCQSCLSFNRIALYGIMLVPM